jgi:hypothetical protein
MMDERWMNVEYMMDEIWIDGWLDGESSIDDD